MTRPVILFTVQCTDLNFEDVCKFVCEAGYDGLEIACWRYHMDIQRAATDPEYIQERQNILAKYNLKCWALGNALAGQCVGDDWDPRLDNFAPDAVKGKPAEIRQWAIQEMTATARAAKNM